MRQHVIRQGEYLTLLAHRMGFQAEDVWNDPKNADLKARRPDMDVLAPGDLVFLPEAKPEPLPIAKGMTNRYVAKVPKVTVRAVLKMEDQPLANEPYIIEGLSEAIEGTTDAEGVLCRDVPVTVRELTVLLPQKNLAYPVRVGDLDPIEETSGVLQRLDHLGYYGWSPGGDRDTVSPDDEVRHRAAIETFQRTQGLEPTGLLDDDTRQALVKAHGA